MWPSSHPLQPNRPVWGSGEGAEFTAELSTTPLERGIARAIAAGVGMTPRVHDWDVSEGVDGWSMGVPHHDNVGIVFASEQ
jgi:hypothetical protein